MFVGGGNRPYAVSELQFLSMCIRRDVTNTLQQLCVCKDIVHISMRICLRVGLAYTLLT